MKLIKAHITNFGKLSDQDFDFSSGLNSFIQENGWGKTTFTVFLKSMFYGMEHSTKKDLDQNEFIKYKPWQGGIYGGNLVFNDGKNEYQVTRTFSSKQKDDTFELRNLSTNKISTDYSENLGQELFGVSKDTFSRSIHIVVDLSPCGTADLSARLNNLVEGQDMTSYDQAVTQLENSAKKLKALKGTGGEINFLQTQIEEKRNYLNEIKQKLADNEKLSIDINEFNEKIKTLTLEQNKISSLLAENAKFQSKQQYLTLKENVTDLEQKLNGIEIFFNGQIPDEPTINRIDEVYKQLDSTQRILETEQMSQSDKDRYQTLLNYFDTNIPNAADLNSILQINEQYNNYLKDKNLVQVDNAKLEEYKSLNRAFCNKDISSQKIEEANKAYEQSLNLSLRISTDQHSLDLINRSQTKKTNPISVISIIFSVLFTAASAFFLLSSRSLIPVIIALPSGLSDTVAACISGVLAIVCIIIFILSKNKKTDRNKIKEIQDLTQAVEDNTKLYNEYKTYYQNLVKSIYPELDPNLAALNQISLDYENYKNLQKEVQAYNNFIETNKDKQNELKAQLSAFALRYSGEQDISSIPALVQNLNQKITALTNLENKVNKNSKLSEEHKTLTQNLTAFLSMYKTNKTKDFEDQIDEIHQNLTIYKDCTVSLKEAVSRIKDFENQNNIEELEKIQKPHETVENLNTALNENNQKINNYTEKKSSCQAVIDRNLTDTERFEDTQDLLESISIKKIEKETEHKVLSYALDFLKQAKEKIDMNYAAPMKQNFEKYLKLLNSKEDLFIDTDLKVSISKNGKTWNSDYLSSGYKDLINFCTRMALIDCLYKENTPPLILDDPFVNLDDDKTKHAVELIAKIAEEKQMLYFSCSKSRS